MSKPAVEALLQATDPHKAQRLSVRRYGRAAKLVASQNAQRIAGGRTPRSTRNQAAIYTAKVHPMDFVTRPSNVERHLGGSSPSKQLARSTSRPNSPASRPLPTSEASNTTVIAPVQPSPGTRKSPRQAANVKKGAYNQRYHPMDSTIRPLRAAKSLAKRNRSDEEVPSISRQSTKRRRSSDHEVEVVKDTDADSGADDTVLLTRSPGRPANNEVEEDHVTPNHQRSFSTFPDSTPSALEKSPANSASTHTATSWYSGRMQVSVVIPWRTPSPTPEAIFSPSTKQISPQQIEHAQEHSNTPPPSDIDPIFSYDDYSAAVDAAKAIEQQQVDKASGADEGTGSDDDDTITVREYVAPADCPWLQAPGLKFNQMTALDQHLYNLQGGKADYEHDRDARESKLPLSWQEVVSRLVDVKGFFTMEDFHRWGGMPAMRARYRILRMIIQGNMAFV